jgi:hypothetical protein
MNVSRRSFVRASSFAGIAAAIAASLPRLALGQLNAAKGPIVKLPKEVLASPLYNLSRMNFYSSIGSTFTFAHPTHGKVGLRLIEVVDLKPLYGKGLPASKECFSLTFQGPFGMVLPQGTYAVTGSKLGPFELFIVPTDEQSPRGLLYEANINRLYP